jgi:hypothetical protein
VAIAVLEGDPGDTPVLDENPARPPKSQVMFGCASSAPATHDEYRRLSPAPAATRPPARGSG